MVQPMPSSGQAVPLPNKLCSHAPLTALQVSSEHGLPSSQTLGLPLHWPSTQKSPEVQAFASLQGVASRAWVTQPTSATQPSRVHGFLSLQPKGVPWHQPLLHLSLVVHASPSLQGKPIKGTALQPVATQVLVVQGLPSSHSASVKHGHAISPGRHLPLSQVSPLVHGSASLQGAALGLWLQPKVASHKSFVHGLPSSQVEAGSGVPTHLPPLQMSYWVHKLPSVQVTSRGKNTQPSLASHLSAVQGDLSSHTSDRPWHWPWMQNVANVHASPSLQGASTFSLHWLGLAGSQNKQGLPSDTACAGTHTGPMLHTAGLGNGTHAPAMHMSMVQGLPSATHGGLSGPDNGSWLQPKPTMQLSPVQGTPSSQSSGFPGLHWPPPHASAAVHGSPSSQGPP